MLKIKVKTRDTGRPFAFGLFDFQPTTSYTSKIKVLKDASELDNIEGEIEYIKVIKEGKYKCKGCNNVSNGYDWDEITLNYNAYYTSYTSISEVSEKQLKYYSFTCPHCKSAFGGAEIVEKSNPFEIDTL